METLLANVNEKGSDQFINELKQLDCNNEKDL